VTDGTTARSRAWLVLGGHGLLGRALGRVLPDARRLGRAECDVTDPVAVRETLETLRPQVVVLSAAFTAVDQCEAAPDAARRLNAEAPGWVAESARAVGARLVHLSTDYVFDGRSRQAWREDDPVGPLSVYGATKLDGEDAVRAVLGEAALIVRAQWLYGPGGPDFVGAILRAARTTPRLRVVDDQTGSPTHVDDLARALHALVDLDARGTVHFSASGACTRAEWARLIVEAAGLDVPVEPCRTEDFPRPAARPQNSVFDLARFSAWVGEAPAPWAPRVRAFVGSTQGPADG
jgi:dTDP-4-dehydrorhamnose reductase